MTQFESRKRDILDSGIQAVFIAAQKRGGVFPPEKFFASHPINFPFLLDEDRKVTKAFGVYHRLGLDAYNIAHPATFVIDPAGRVRFRYVGATQTDRAPLDEVIQVATACKSSSGGAK